MKALTASAFSTLLQSFPSLQQTQTLAVAVSGGPDSMALCLLTQKWATKHQKKMVALTVDHGLRPGSTREALQVQSWLRKRDIDHHILPWKHKKIDGNIQAKAREARYALLMDWCHKHHINVLMVAHHLNDQAETFLINLSRGSGLHGLCGMSPLLEKENLLILRPFLSVPKKTLVATCKAFKQPFVEDPSNDKDDFLRVRIRKLLPLLEKDMGLTPARINLAIQNLQRAKDALDQEVEKLIQAPWQVQSLIEAPNEVALRALAKILQQVGSKQYPPRFENLQRFYEKLKKNQIGAGITLGGCLIKVKKGQLVLQREN